MKKKTNKKQNKNKQRAQYDENDQTKASGSLRNSKYTVAPLDGMLFITNDRNTLLIQD